MKHPPQNHSSASSGEYWTELYPDALSLRVFLSVACISAVTGAVLLMMAAIGIVGRASLVLLWLFACGRAVWRRVLVRHQIQTVRVFAGGGARIRLVRGDWLEGQLRPGTLAVGPAAWLRMRAVGSRSVDLFVLRNRQDVDHWRRFRVIYRHIGPNS